MRWCLLALLVFCFTATPAAAHDLNVERSLAIQMHPSHAELLLVYVEPPGPRTDRILALYDANRNGTLDGSEGLLAKSPMLRRARLGLDVTFTGALTSEKEPQVRFKRDKSGGIAMAVYQRIDFVAQKDKLSVDVTVGKRKGIPALQLVVEVGDDWQFAVEGAKAANAVEAGTSLRFPLTRVEQPQPTADPRRQWQPPEDTRPQ